MAFVNKSQRFSSVNQKPATDIDLGPGTYLQHSQYNLKHSYAPFNSTENRIDLKKKKGGGLLAGKNPTPGPGSYNITKEAQTEKVLVSTVNQDIKIIEVPKESSVFKSSTKRLDLKGIDVPGPGTYSKDYEDEIEKEHQRIQIKNIQNECKNKNIIDQIMKVNKYQQIPSIPSQKQAFGYSENEQNELELNKCPVVVHKGTQQDSIGPGQYAQADFIKLNKNRGTSWAKYTQKRLAKPKVSATTTIGPGAYEQFNAMKPLYKYKPSSGFASKSLRLFDQRKGALANKHIMQKVQNQAKFLTSDLDRQDTVNAIDDEFEYIEDTIPGPGHYQPNISSMKVQFKPEKLQFFGSSSLRFKSISVPSSSVGPGDYYRNGIVSSKQHSNVLIPFSSQKIRFDPQQLSEVPGPGTYNPKLNLEDSLIKKIQFGYKGQFGTSEKRFISNEEMEELPGPGQYIGQNTNALANKPQYFLKEAPPVGSYDMDFYDIGKKQIRDEELDPEYHVKVEGLGFSTSQPRFVESKKNKLEAQLMEDKDDSMLQNNSSLGDLFKLKKKQIDGLAFQSKDQRFKQDKSKKTIPGPGQYYDAQLNPWNKRTYNIEFTGMK